MVMVLFAYMLRSWHHIQLAYGLFSLLLISHYFMIPESPRWLIENKRPEEAKQIFIRIAKFNGVKWAETKFGEYFLALEEKSSVDWDLGGNRMR